MANVELLILNYPIDCERIRPALADTSQVLLFLGDTEFGGNCEVVAFRSIQRGHISNVKGVEPFLI
jgi:hypothetical protein